MAPKVSILIPVYNVEGYVGRCLESCVKQTLEDIEIICVNDGSLDNSLDVIASFAKDDRRIKIINKPNGGLPSSRNVGLDAAKGEYVLFLDSDDYIDLDACEKLYAKAKEHDASVVVFGALVEPEEKNTEWTQNIFTVEERTFDLLAPKDFLSLPYMFPFLWRDFVKREHIEKNHFRLDERIVIGEDVAFQFKILPLAVNVVCVKDKFYHYDCGRIGSLTNNKKYSDIIFKIDSHLFLLDCLYRDWKDRGIIERYGESFFDWAVDFLYWGFTSATTTSKPELAKKIVAEFEKIEIGKFLSSVSERIQKEYEDYTYWANYEFDGQKPLTLILNAGFDADYGAFLGLIEKLLPYRQHLNLEVMMHYYSPEKYIQFEKACLEYDFIHFTKVDDYSEYDCYNDAIRSIESTYVGFVTYDCHIPYGMADLLEGINSGAPIIVTSKGRIESAKLFVELPLANFVVKRDYLRQKGIEFRKFGTLSSLFFKLELFQNLPQITFVNSFMLCPLEWRHYVNELKPKNEYLDCVLALLDLYEKTKDEEYRFIASAIYNDPYFVRIIASEPFAWSEKALPLVDGIFEKILKISNSNCIIKNKSLDRALIEFIRNRHTQMAGLVKAYAAPKEK